MAADDQELASALADVDEPVFTRHTFTEDEVVGIINRMKLARSTCPQCARVGYESVLRGYWFMQFMAAADNNLDIGELTIERAAAWDYMRAHGFEEMSEAAGWLKRCASCASAPAFPWAAELEPARVLRFVNTDERCEGPWPLSILQETLPGYVRPAPAAAAAPTPGSFESLAAEAGGIAEAETHRAAS